MTFVIFFNKNGLVYKKTIKDDVLLSSHWWFLIGWLIILSESKVYTFCWCQVNHWVTEYSGL